jgi:hypothetical protein
MAELKYFHSLICRHLWQTVYYYPCQSETIFYQICRKCGESRFIEEQKILKYPDLTPQIERERFRSLSALKRQVLQKMSFLFEIITSKINFHLDHNNSLGVEHE